MNDAAAVELSALPKLCIDLADPGLRIVHPAGANYAAMAGKLADALADSVGTPIMVTSETEPTALRGSGPLLVLGNLMVSTTVQRLYYAAYDFTDLAFPGPGGYVLRTIRDPLGTGAHVILIGGSDSEGVSEAALKLVERVQQQGPVWGYYNEVRLGKWTTSAELDMARYLIDNDEVWGRVGESGSWEYMEHIAACALGYLRTADECYLELFRRELHYYRTHDVYAPNPEAPMQIHGRIYVLLLVWDLVQDHPLFTPEDRREFDAMFLYLERSGEGVVQITDRAATTAVRFNHDTRAALDAFFVGRYFNRRHQLPEAQGWLEIAAQLFAPQLTSAKPAEDSWGHQWTASMHNTLVYAMATGRHDYFTSPAFRQAADRALMAHGVDGPRVYLANCAVVTGDSSYLSLERDGDSYLRAAARMRLSKPADSPLPASFEEVLRSFATTDTIQRRGFMLGLTVAPVDPLWYHTIETPAYNPEGIFKVTVSASQGFDKLAWREGWAKNSFYLLLDGISGGLHSFQDANCLVWLRDGGLDWFRPVASYERAQGVRAQNGVNVVLNGRGLDHVHRYARLLYQEVSGEFSAAGSALIGIGDTTWERHVLRKQGAWTLVLDRVVAHKAGELLAERFWYPQGQREVHAAGFSIRQTVEDRARLLHIASTVDADGCMDSGLGLVERVRADVDAGGNILLVGLMWTEANPETSFKLRKDGAGISIVDGSGISVAVTLQCDAGMGCGLVVQNAGSNFMLGRPGLAVTIPTIRALPLVPDIPPGQTAGPKFHFPGKSITAVAARPTSRVVGTADGMVVALDADWRERWRAQFQGAILSLEISTEGVVVGEDSGALSLVDTAGHIHWTVQIPWVSLPWSNWSECRSRIREVACADMNGDGREEILISNADRRVYAFDHAGHELWKRPIQWGVFTAMWPGRHEGKITLLGGTSRPSIHGYVVLLNGDGTVRGNMQRADLTCWGLPANLRDLQQADIDGDGELETITAVDTNCRQLIAYDADGKVKWDCDVGACASSLVFDSTTGRVYVTSEAGYVVAVESSSGKRLWVAWIGAASALVWVLPDGRLAVVARKGFIWLLLPTGEIRSRIELGAAITAMPRPGDHRGPGRILILGTADGRVIGFGGA